MAAFVLLLILKLLFLYSVFNNFRSMIEKSQIDYIAAGHAIDLGGHVAGVVGRQEDIDMRQFDRLSCPSQQGFLPELRQGAFGLSVIQLQRCPDWSRCHAVHADAFLGELLRQTDCEAGDRGLDVRHYHLYNYTSTTTVLYSFFSNFSIFCSASILSGRGARKSLRTNL